MDALLKSIEPFGVKIVQSDNSTQIFFNDSGFITIGRNIIGLQPNTFDGCLFFTEKNFFELFPMKVDFSDNLERIRFSSFKYNFSFGLNLADEEYVDEDTDIVDVETQLIFSNLFSFICDELNRFSKINIEKKLFNL